MVAPLPAPVERIVSSPLLVSLDAHLVYVGEPVLRFKRKLIGLSRNLKKPTSSKYNTSSGEVAPSIIQFADENNISLLSLWLPMATQKSVNSLSAAAQPSLSQALINPLYCYVKR